MIVCETPCMVDECPSHRAMPLAEHATFSLDGERAGKATVASDGVRGLLGNQCVVIAERVSIGEHALNITANVAEPLFVLVSHLVWF